MGDAGREVGGVRAGVGLIGMDNIVCEGTVGMRRRETRLATLGQLHVPMDQRRW
jgi:hypothetical protein